MLVSALTLSTVALLSPPAAASCTIDAGAPADLSYCDGNCLINGVMSACAAPASCIVNQGVCSSGGSCVLNIEGTCHGSCLVNAVFSDCGGECTVNIVWGRCGEDYCLISVYNSCSVTNELERSWS